MKTLFFTFVLLLFTVTPSRAQNCANQSEFIMIDAQGDTISDGGLVCIFNLPLRLQPIEDIGQFSSIPGLLPGTNFYNPVVNTLTSVLDGSTVDINFTYINATQVCVKTISISLTPLPTILAPNNAYTHICEEAGQLPLIGDRAENGQFYLNEISEETAIDTLPYETMADGTHELIYIYTDPSTNCPSQTTIQLYKNIDLVQQCDQISDGQQFCANASRIRMSCPAFTSFMAASGLGVSTTDAIQDYYFDPKEAGLGDHLITFSYHSFGCPEPITQHITVNVLDSTQSPCIVGIEEIGNSQALITDVQAYPNPFSEQTTIRYTLNEPTTVTIVIYDITGKVVTTLLQQEWQAIGTHSLPIPAAPWSVGTYFYEISTPNAKHMGKLLLLE